VQSKLKLSGNGNEFKPLPGMQVRVVNSYAAASESVPVSQGLTLVHFSAQLERCVWDRGCT